jgi:enhancing lycopene biosynthesis protein 2
MKKIAVILSGCGVFDGAEIHEATLTLLAVRKAGCEYQVFAPDIEQADVVNHATGKPAAERRNVLAESARIARGKAKPLTDFNAEEYDALIMPGGFGAAKNLCNFAFKGADYTALPELEKALKHMHELGKPIGAMCIAPVILAKVFRGCEVTVGNAGGESAIIEQNGSKHAVKNHAELAIDSKYRLVTTPCYMLDADITQIAAGAENLVKALIKMM